MERVILNAKKTRQMVQSWAVAALMLPVWAVAGVIYDNGAPVTTLPGWASNFSVDDEQTAEIFTLASDETVTDVHWFGGVQGLGTPSEFTVQIYATPLGGTPDTSALLSETIHNMFSAEDTGLDTNFGTSVIDIFEYGVQIPDLVLPAGDYAISIFESSNISNRWAWSNTGVDSDVFTSSPIGSGAWVAIDRSMAFYLTDDFLVPEPATLAMLVLGLAGIGYRHKRSNVNRKHRLPVTVGDPT